MRAFALAVVFAAAALSACNPKAPANGSSPHAAKTAAAAGPDPCSLITQAEAAAALQGPVGAAQKGSGFGQFEQCQYLSAGERIADTGAVTIQVHPVDLASKRKALKASGETAQAVQGIGDGAFWAPGQSSLYVGKNGLTFSFSATKSGVDAEAASRRLAELGLQRIQ